MSGEYFWQEPKKEREPQPKAVFDEFVFKLSSRCNMQPPEPGALSLRQLDVVNDHGTLGCDQCYEFVGTDAWKEQPPIMEPEVVRRGAERIAEHAAAHDLSDVRIIAHGGEPFMGGANHIDEFATIIRETIETDSCEVHLSVQTNGWLLTDRMVKVLEKHDISVGLSVDGDKVANDRHRRDQLGRSTYDRVVAAADKLNNSSLDWGALVVIDTRNNPEETLDAVASLGPSSISMFPPHANHTTPPVDHPDSISLGEWQTRVFDHYRTWQHRHGEPAPFTMPIVDGYVKAFLGAAPTHERISNRYPQELFILPNGDLQRLDTLKSTERGAFEMPYNVFDKVENILDVVSQKDPGYIARRMGDAALATECQQCIFKDTCGGEYYPNRYRSPEQPLTPNSPPEDFQEAFKNPSIYCDSQMEYLGFIKKYVERQRNLLEKTTLEPRKVREAWNASETRLKRELSYPKALRPLLEGIERSDSHYCRFPRSTGQPPDIPEEQAEELLEFLSTGTYPGRSTLHALAIMHKRYGLNGAKLFFQASPRISSKEHFRTVKGLTQDINQAIVQALFSPENTFLADVNFKLRRSGDYWLVTENALNVHANLHSSGIAGNSFVDPIIMNARLMDEFYSRRLSIDDEKEIDSEPLWPCSIQVNLSDAPGDLLIVGTGKGANADIEALDLVAEQLHDYLTPELFYREIETHNAAINFRPLCNSWPSSYNAKGWYPTGRGILGIWGKPSS